jgi:hypothetical protein
MELNLKWDSKIWSRVLRDLDLRATAVARHNSTCSDRLQSRPLVRVTLTRVHTDWHATSSLSWRTVSRPVCSAIRSPPGTRDQCFFLFYGHSLKKFPDIFMDGPLWREDGSVIFHSVTPQTEPRRIRNYTLLYKWRLRSSCLYPAGTGWPIYNPTHWVQIKVQKLTPYMTSV